MSGARSHLNRLFGAGRHIRLAAVLSFIFIGGASIGLWSALAHQQEKPLPVESMTPGSSAISPLPLRDLSQSSTRLQRMNDPDAAITAYKAAVKLKPDYAAAHCELALLYVATGDLDAAIEEHSTLTSLDQKLADKLYAAINK